jgi:sodium transport system permease protein
MQIQLVKVIFLKEIRDTLRDRRTLFVMVILPLLLYPLLMIGVMQMTMLQMGRIEQKQSRVVFIGREHAGDLAVLVDSLPGITLMDSAGWRERIIKNDLEATLSVPAGFADSVAAGHIPAVDVYFNSSKEVSDKARDRLEKMLGTFKEQVVARRLTALATDTTLLRPFAVAYRNVATAQQKQGDGIGRFLGYFLIIMTLMGAFYPSVDLTSGEKERGTMETLLVSPASRAEIVYGKFFAVLTISVLTALLNLMSMGGTMFYMARMLGEAASMAMPSLAISPLSLLLTLLLILPLAVAFSAVCLAIAVTARNYKEGTSLLSPLMTLAIFPAMISMLPGTEMSPTMALIPIANVSLLIKEIMMGSYPWLEIVLALASTSVLAMGALWWATSQFSQESVMFRHADDIKWSPFRKKYGRIAAELPSSGIAMVVVAVELIALSLLGLVAGKWELRQSVLLSQLVVLLPALLIVRLGGHNRSSVFRLKMPPIAAWPATLLLIIGGWLLSVELATLQNAVTPFPKDMLEKFAHFFDTLNAMPLGQALSLVAVLPGLCEEMLCRGFLLSSFKGRLGGMGAVIFTAVCFGLLHLDPYRLISTMFLGLLLGFIVLRTGSIYPAMLAHAANNALSFLVQKHESYFTGIGWLNLENSEFLPWPIVTAAVILVAAGLYWVKKIGENRILSDELSSTV